MRNFEENGFSRGTVSLHTTYMYVYYGILYLFNNSTIIFHRKYTTKAEVMLTNASARDITRTLLCHWAGVVGAVGKISAFQPQGPRFDPPALPRFEYLCSLLFHLSQLSFPSFRGMLMSTSVCWKLTCDGLVSHPGGETGDKPGSISHYRLVKGFSLLCH